MASHARQVGVGRVHHQRGVDAVEGARAGPSGSCRRRPPRPGVPRTTRRPPSSSATAAAASPAPRPAVAMTLWPQAWPISGRASYSHSTAIVGAVGAGRGPRRRCRARRRARSTFEAGVGERVVSRSWAWCSSNPARAWTRGSRCGAAVDWHDLTLGPRRSRTASATDIAVASEPSPLRAVNARCRSEARVPPTGRSTGGAGRSCRAARPARGAPAPSGYSASGTTSSTWIGRPCVDERGDARRTPGSCPSSSR